MVLTAFLTSIQCEVVHNHLFLVIVKVAINPKWPWMHVTITGAGTMFLDAFDACLCDFVGGTTWNLQHVRLLSTWIGIPGDQVKSFVFFQLNPAVLSPETSLGPVFFVLLWHVRLCKDILSFICILLFVGLKATYVFFSWLNYFLLASELNTLAMCGLVFVIGFLMFMLPIVPGTAVYLFSGVVAWFDWFEGHWAGVTYHMR